MNMTRRLFLGALLILAPALSLGVQPQGGLEHFAGFPIGTCMIGLKAAREAGLDGVQIPLHLDGDQLDVAKPNTRMPTAAR